jgi:pyridoxine 5-phosphate synthase
MRARHQRLYVNIDHVATLRQARRGREPDPVAAAIACQEAGADGITAHLREDRRHIQDDDIGRLRRDMRTFFNLELACVPEMVAIAERIRPDQVTFVPERREEITTEGGLNVAAARQRLDESIKRLRNAGIRVSLFIDPEPEVVELSHELGIDAIELHTGRYSVSPKDERRTVELRDAATLAARLGVAVHAGHGLSAENVRAVAAIPQIEELNIGHSIVARSIFVGLPAAVREIREAMRAARGETLLIPAP